MFPFFPQKILYPKILIPIDNFRFHFHFPVFYLSLTKLIEFHIQCSLDISELRYKRKLFISEEFEKSQPKEYDFICLTTLDISEIRYMRKLLISEDIFAPGCTFLIRYKRNSISSYSM